MLDITVQMACQPRKAVTRIYGESTRMRLFSYNFSWVFLSSSLKRNVILYQFWHISFKETNPFDWLSFLRKSKKKRITAFETILRENIRRISLSTGGKDFFVSAKLCIEFPLWGYPNDRIHMLLKEYHNWWLWNVKPQKPSDVTSSCYHYSLLHYVCAICWKSFW